jgi:hypothetical protein
VTTGTPLVGPNGRVAQDLADRVLALSHTREDALLLIDVSTPSGWGKTRLIQEVDERLVLTQQGSAYWVSGMAPAPADHDRSRVRGHLAPDARGLVPWLWVGVRGDLSGEDELGWCLHQFATQLRAAERVLKRQDELKEAGRQVAYEVGRRVAVTGAAFIPGAGALLEAALEVGMSTNDGVGLLRRVQRADATRREIGDPVEALQDDLAAEIAASLQRLNNRARKLLGYALPLVIFLDDANEVDERTLAFVRSLLTEAGGERDLSAPVAIIATSRPESNQLQAEQGAGFGAWIREVGSELAADAPTVAVETVRVGYASDSDLRLRPLSVWDARAIIDGAVEERVRAVAPVELMARRASEAADRAEGPPAELLLRYAERAVERFARDPHALDAEWVATLPCDLVEAERELLTELGAREPRALRSLEQLGRLGGRCPEVVLTDSSVEPIDDALELLLGLGLIKRFELDFGPTLTVTRERTIAALQHHLADREADRDESERLRLGTGMARWLVDRVSSLLAVDYELRSGWFRRSLEVFAQYAMPARDTVSHVPWARELLVALAAQDRHVDRRSLGSTSAHIHGLCRDDEDRDEVWLAAAILTARWFERARRAADLHTVVAEVAEWLTSQDTPPELLQSGSFATIAGIVLRDETSPYGRSMLNLLARAGASSSSAALLLATHGDGDDEDALALIARHRSEPNPRLREFLGRAYATRARSRAQRATGRDWLREFCRANPRSAVEFARLVPHREHDDADEARIALRAFARLSPYAAIEFLRLATDGDHVEAVGLARRFARQRIRAALLWSELPQAEEHAEEIFEALWVHRHVTANTDVRVVLARRAANADQRRRALPLVRVAARRDARAAAWLIRLGDQEGGRRALARLGGSDEQSGMPSGFDEAAAILDEAGVQADVDCALGLAEVAQVRPEHRSLAAERLLPHTADDARAAAAYAALIEPSDRTARRDAEDRLASFVAQGSVDCALAFVQLYRLRDDPRQRQRYTAARRLLVERAKDHQQAALWLLENAGNPRQATAAWHDVLRYHADDPAAVVRLAAATEDDDRRPAVLRRLLALVEEHQDVQAASALLRLARSSPERRPALRWLHQRSEEDADAAITLLRHTLPADPTRSWAVDRASSHAAVSSAAAIALAAEASYAPEAANARTLLAPHVPFRVEAARAYAELSATWGMAPAQTYDHVLTHYEDDVAVLITAARLARSDSQHLDVRERLVAVAMGLRRGIRTRDPRALATRETLRGAVRAGNTAAAPTLPFLTPSTFTAQTAAWGQVWEAAETDLHTAFYLGERARDLFRRSLRLEDRRRVGELIDRAPPTSGDQRSRERKRHPLSIGARSWRALRQHAVHDARAAVRLSGQVTGTDGARVRDAVELLVKHARGSAPIVLELVAFARAGHVDDETVRDVLRHHISREALATSVAACAVSFGVADRAVLDLIAQRAHEGDAVAVALELTREGALEPSAAFELASRTDPANGGAARESLRTAASAGNRPAAVALARIASSPADRREASDLLRRDGLGSVPEAVALAGVAEGPHERAEARVALEGVADRDACAARALAGLATSPSQRRTAFAALRNHPDDLEAQLAAATMATADHERLSLLGPLLRAASEDPRAALALADLDRRGLTPGVAAAIVTGLARSDRAVAAAYVELEGSTSAAVEHAWPAINEHPEALLGISRRTPEQDVRRRCVRRYLEVVDDGDLDRNIAWEQREDEELLPIVHARLREAADRSPRAAIIWLGTLAEGHPDRPMARNSLRRHARGHVESLLRLIQFSKRDDDRLELYRWLRDLPHYQDAIEAGLAPVRDLLGPRLGREWDRAARDSSRRGCRYATAAAVVADSPTDRQLAWQALERFASGDAMALAASTLVVPDGPARRRTLTALRAARGRDRELALRVLATFGESSAFAAACLAELGACSRWPESRSWLFDHASVDAEAATALARELRHASSDRPARRRAFELLDRWADSDLPRIQRLAWLVAEDEDLRERVGHRVRNVAEQEPTVRGWRREECERLADEFGVELPWPRTTTAARVADTADASHIPDGGPRRWSTRRRPVA